MARKRSKKLSSLRALKITVIGNVQGVGFRRVVQKLARHLEITGHVKNMKDGSVGILAQGSSSKLNTFTSAIKVKEAPIDVERIEIKDTRASRGLKIFEIKHGALPEEMDEGLGAGQEQLVLLRKVFDDFSRRTDKNFTTLANRYDKISETLGGVLKESTQTREDFKLALERMTAQNGEFRDAIETLTNLARDYFVSKK
ncbi:MAG: acylphosphatase [Nitrososphaerales archaeon]